MDLQIPIQNPHPKIVEGSTTKDQTKNQKLVTLAFLLTQLSTKYKIPSQKTCLVGH